MPTYTSKYTGAEIDERLDLAKTNETAITALKVQVGSNYNTLYNYILDLQSADETINSSIGTLSSTVSSNYSTLKTAITTDYSTLMGYIEDLQNNGATLSINISEKYAELLDADTAIKSSIGSLSSTVSTNYTTLNTLISNNYETLSTTITSNYNELSGDISDLSDTVSSNYETLSIMIGEKANAGTVASHINNPYLHVADDERTLWNSGISYSLPSESIPDEADADDYTTDGQYKASSPSTLTNFAQNTYGFELIVMHTTSSNRGMQIMLCSNGDIYVRAFNSANSNGAFYGMSWKQLTS